MWKKSPLHLPMLAATSVNLNHIIKSSLNNFSKDFKIASTSRNLSHSNRKKLMNPAKYTNILNSNKLKIKSWWTAISSARKDWSKKYFLISKMTSLHNTLPSSKPKPIKKSKSNRLSSTTTPKLKVSPSNNSPWWKEVKDTSMSSRNLPSWKKCWSIKISQLFCKNISWK